MGQCYLPANYNVLFYALCQSKQFIYLFIYYFIDIQKVNNFIPSLSIFIPWFAQGYKNVPSADSKCASSNRVAIGWNGGSQGEIYDPV